MGARDGAFDVRTKIFSGKGSRALRPQTWPVSAVPASLLVAIAQRLDARRLLLASVGRTVGIQFRNQLTALVAFAREGTMTRAAEKLHFSLSTVSRLIARLERNTPHRLLDPGTTPPTLTEHGRQTVALACALLCGIDEIAGTPPPGPGTDGCHASPDLPCVGTHSCPGRGPSPDSSFANKQL